jgi:uncharacterized protein (DUF2141 family)
MMIRSMLMLGLLLLPCAGRAQTLHTVEVFVKGLRAEDGGQLYLQLLNASGEQVNAVKLPIERSVVLQRFTDVPPGTYAARCYADVNGNAQLDLGFMGIPKEAVGSSNNARGFLSAPKLKDMLFTVDRATTISFDVIYY